jgi:hypothetical protein
LQPSQAGTCNATAGNTITYKTAGNTITYNKTAGNTITYNKTAGNTVTYNKTAGANFQVGTSSIEEAYISDND